MLNLAGLSVTNKPCMLNVVMLIVIMPNVVAPCFCSSVGLTDCLSVFPYKRLFICCLSVCPSILNKVFPMFRLTRDFRKLITTLKKCIDVDTYSFNAEFF
jgi:hypothetical protein